LKYFLSRLENSPDPIEKEAILLGLGHISTSIEKRKDLHSGIE